MIELFVLMLVLGGLWLGFALIGVVFKLVFGLIGGIFSLVGGLIALCVGTVVMLAMVPVIALALVPLLLPVLLIAGLVWLIARASRRPQPAAAITH